MLGDLIVQAMDKDRSWNLKLVETDLEPGRSAEKFKDIFQVWISLHPYN
jgi:hypothetical protein